MAIEVASIDVSETDKRHVIWCSKDGVNTGATGDTGELGGETISSSAWVATSGSCTFSPAGTGDPSTSTGSLAAITILHDDGVAYSYGINTVATITISAVTAGDDGNLTLRNRIVTSGSRTLDQTVIVPVEVH